MTDNLVLFLSNIRQSSTGALIENNISCTEDTENLLGILWNF